MKNIKKYSTLIVLVAILILFIILSSIFTFQQTRLLLSNAQPLNENWTDIESGLIFDLPNDFNLDKNEVQSISITLPNDFEEQQHILIRGSLQDVIVSLDGNTIYSYDLRDENKGTPYASLWHVIEVPENSEGSTLTVTLHSPFTSMSGLTNEIFYGAVNDLNVYILQNFGGRLLIGLITLFMGILFSILSLFVDKIKNNDVVYIGLFGITLAIWMIAESRTLQFLVDSQYIHGATAYIMLAILPIPMGVYVKRHVLKRYENLYLFVTIYFIVQFIAIIVLQALGLVAFFVSVVVTQLSIAITILITIILLVFEIKKYPEKKVAKRFLFYFGVLAAIIILEIVAFSSKDFDIISIYVQWIALFFIFMLLGRYIYVLNINMKFRLKSEMLEELVYIDRLTSGKNRHAFEEDLDHIFSVESLKKQLRIVYFDFDDLKTINDKFGHYEGDQILIDGYHIINSVFGEQGVCYRIGGDEFSCLLNNISDEVYHKKANIFIEKLKAYNDQRSYPIGISFGSATYNEEFDIKPKDLVKRADEQMYKAKDNLAYKDINN
jgi:diguanylate cyclase (GGDEF)-like protein